MHANLRLRRRQLATFPAPVSVGRQLMPRGGAASGVSAATMPIVAAMILPPFRMLLNMVILSPGYT